MSTMTPEDLNDEIAFLIDVVYPAAQSAYTVMSLPTPPLSLPPGYVLQGTINANPQEAAALMQQANPDQQRLANHMVSESSIFGLVAWDQAAQTAIVAIRGTQNLQDWVNDLEALLLPYAPFPDAGTVHMGFLVVYQHIRGSIASLLRACAGVKRVIVTGHSLGGALAVLCAFDVLKNLGLGLVPEAHTFAGPRVASPHFAGQFDALVPICRRVVNFLDVVPQVPLPPLYQHVGEEILVHGGFKPWDISYAHHLSTYLAGLHKLPGAPAPGYTVPTSTSAVSAATVAGAKAVVAAAQAGAAAVIASAEGAEAQAEEVAVAPDLVNA